MAVLLRPFLFIHVQKTGGIWTEAVLLNLSKRARKIAKPHRHRAIFDLSTEINLEGIIPFCFVRDPADWYRSYWAFKCRHFRDNPNPFDLATFPALVEFPEFILRASSMFPGYCGDNYARMTAGVPIIGRFSHLRSDLQTILSLAPIPGVSLEKIRCTIRDTKVKNAGNSDKKARAVITPEIEKQVQEADPLAYYIWDTTANRRWDGDRLIYPSLSLIPQPALVSV